MDNARSSYGVVLAGCSGREVVRFPRRHQADRVRVAVRAHLAAGGWDGAYTLRCVAVPRLASSELRAAVEEWA